MVKLEENMVTQAWGFLKNPQNWVGADGISSRLLEHLGYTFVVLGIATLLALPLGLYLGHKQRPGGLILALVNLARAIPTLGLLTLLVLTFGIGFWPPIISLIIIAIPPILASTFSGIQAQDQQVISAARAIGMRDWQVLTKVEIPIGAPVIMGGFRSAFLQVIATTTIAAYVNLGGFGRYILDGLAQYNYGLVLAGAILVMALAVLVDAVLAAVTKLISPRVVN